MSCSLFGINQSHHKRSYHGASDGGIFGSTASQSKVKAPVREKGRSNVHIDETE